VGNSDAQVRDLSEQPFVDGLLYSLGVASVEPRQRDYERDPLALGSGNHLFCLLLGGRDHLLGKHVLAGSRDGRDHLTVGDRRRGDHHTVHIFTRQKLVEVLVERDAASLGL
jgi:hypothetical protein